MSDGWIKLHRKILDCFIWQDKPYDKARAWIDLLLLAMHSDKKMLVGIDTVTIKRGSFLTSRVKLADRWGWGVKKVDTYLSMLEKEEMITTIRTRKGTMITIVNYENYQVLNASEEDTTTGVLDKTKNRNEKESKSKIIKEAQELFEKLWEIYPVKKGKGQVSNAAKQRLLKVGYDEMVRAIDRYRTELDKDSSWRKPQNGSTFFNSGYVDYLDSNFVPKEHKQIKSKNTFNDFDQRNTDYNKIEDILSNL